MHENESFLSLEVIWKDDDMLEVEVSVSTKSFKGVTQAYDTDTHLKGLAKQLKGYPNSQEQIFYQAGIEDGYAYYSFRFYPLGVSGLVGIQVHLEDNVPTEYRPEEKAKLALELVAEPSAIDTFQQYLLTMADKQAGKAVLIGR